MTDKKAPAKTPAKPTRPRRKTPDWGALASKSESAPREEIEREEAAPVAAPAAPKPDATPAVKVTPSGKVIPVTKAQTFRLPPDALQIIAEEKAEEAALGKRLTNDAAVAEALRMWGKARRQARQRQREREAEEAALGKD